MKNPLRKSSSFNNLQVAIVNHVTWTVILSLYCDPVIRESNYLGKVFKEVEVKRRDWASDFNSVSVPDQHIRYKSTYHIILIKIIELMDN